MYNQKNAFVAAVEEDPSEVHVVHLKPGLVMIDTGCRVAVGGKEWHRGLQRKLKEMGRPFHAEEQLEYFQLGPGEPIVSRRCWRYQVGVQGVDRELRISEVPVECPGLIGPSELAAWRMMLNFENKTFSSAGKTTPITYARSGHPCMSLLEYEDLAGFITRQWSSKSQKSRLNRQK